MKNIKSLDLKSVRRKAVTISQDETIEVKQIQLETSLPLVIQPSVQQLNLVDWARNNRPFIETQLIQAGGILFRNFKVKEAAEFEQFMQTISGKLLKYSYQSTPRTEVGQNIYTSTEYPAQLSIPLHNEMSYSRSWPLKIWFFCVKSAESGGYTPIADSRKVFEGLDPQIKEQFIQKKVMYVRNYSEGLDLPWQRVFQTANKSDVEAYCHQAQIEFEWLEGDRLRTRQICQAIATHPQTGEQVWFNQAHLFHLSSLPPKVRESLLSTFNEEDLPRHAYYGDGSPIEPSVIAQINQVYQQQAVSFPWQTGDILMLDNMLTAHGRTPFSGTRKVLVGMAEEFHNQQYLGKETWLI